jgi:hypothetical protein
MRSGWGTRNSTTRQWLRSRTIDGRCASIRADDIDGIRAIYPGRVEEADRYQLSLHRYRRNSRVGIQPILNLFGGTAPFTWSLVAGQGTLPAGLSLSGAGLISGTPTASGTSNFTVRVTDNPERRQPRRWSIVVSAGGGGGPLNPEFVTQTVPTNVQPVSNSFPTCRLETQARRPWNGSAYFFASRTLR